MTRTLHTATVGVLALMLGATFALPLHAQDRPDDQRDQRDQPAQDHQAPPDEHRAAPAPERRGASNDVATLRRAHPHAAARCHDGFFTNTRDRARACSKHGGIDIWLAL